MSQPRNDEQTVRPERMHMVRYDRGRQAFDLDDVVGLDIVVTRICVVRVTLARNGAVVVVEIICPSAQDAEIVLDDICAHIGAYRNWASR